MMDAIRSSETSVPIRTPRRNTHKTAFFIVTAVKTSELTDLSLLDKVSRSVNFQNGGQLLANGASF
jgi:hypothetical protein